MGAVMIEQMQVRLFGKSALDQLSDDVFLLCQYVSGRIGKFDLFFIQEAKNILFCHSSFQLMLFQMNVVVHNIHFYPGSFFGNLIRAVT